MNLTADEIIAILDCINNRIDDLQDCAMFGDGEAIEGEIKSLEALIVKVGEPLSEGEQA